jgi:chemotaxis protein methyltransferase CheR
MTADIPDTLIASLSRLINSRTGLYFPREKWRELKRNIRAAAPDLGFTDPEQCIRWMLSAELTQQQADTVVAHLTIGETYFFRDREVFAALKDHVLVPLAQSQKRSQRRIRFWSAACSSGEEPYSIAILLDQMEGLLRGWEISMLATDINTRFLEKAKQGIYTQWSFRNMSERLMKQYFTKTGNNRYEISPRIKNRVTFSRLNLIEQGAAGPPAATGAMDVIFCRNVLMYLSPDMRRRVIHRLMTSLAEDGWLIVSPAETSLVETPTLRPIRFPKAIFHKKVLQETATQETMEMGVVPRGHERRRVAEGVIPVLHHQAPTPSRETPAAPGNGPVAAKQDSRHEKGPNPYDEALALYKKGLCREAAERLERLFSAESGGASSPDLIPAMTLLARACADLGRLEEARKWCEKAAAMKKLDPDVHALLAVIYQELGLTEEPVKALKRVIYLDPDRIMAYFSLGHLMGQQGKEAEAKRCFASARDLLTSMKPDETVPHSDGLTAERLQDAIEMMMMR